MYVPYYQNKEQYELFIENRKKDILYLKNAIDVAKKRIKDKEFYQDWLSSDELIFDK